MDTLPQRAEVFALKLECPVSARSKRQLRVKDRGYTKPGGSGSRLPRVCSVGSLILTDVTALMPTQKLHCLNFLLLQLPRTKTLARLCPLGSCRMLYPALLVCH